MHRRLLPTVICHHLESEKARMEPTGLDEEQSALANSLATLSFCSSDLHHDLAFGSTLFEIGQRLLRLIERKYLINYRTDDLCLEKLANLGELAAVWMHK